MTDEQFKKEIARLRRRATLLELARSGSAEVIKIEVEGHWVKRHRVRKHTRVLYRRRDSK